MSACVLPQWRCRWLSSAITALTCFSFLFTCLIPSGISYGQTVAPTVLQLPVPGTQVFRSEVFTPALIKGLMVHPENPLQFDFILDKGAVRLEGEALRKESTRLIKYFLVSLTVPEQEMWVNLAPYEKNRIILEKFGVTEMGRDLLAQDYLLKQLTASLLYPEKALGKTFWRRVYAKAQEKNGTTDIPLDTFNKIWIVPQRASIYEHDRTALVVDSHLKVMLEEDYKARLETGDQRPETKKNSSSISTEIIREVLIPEIEKEVNEGKTFAGLRQIYNSMILATWYKNSLKESLLGKIYVDQNKIRGVDVEDKSIKQKIYDQYLQAFQKGVYSYIKEEYDPKSQSVIPKKYFSGGFNAFDGAMLAERVKENAFHGAFDALSETQARLVRRSLPPEENAVRIGIKLAEIGEHAATFASGEELQIEILKGDIRMIEESIARQQGESIPRGRIINLQERRERRKEDGSDEAMMTNDSGANEIETLHNAFLDNERREKISAGAVSLQELILLENKLLKPYNNAFQAVRDLKETNYDPEVMKRAQIVLQFRKQDLILVKDAIQAQREKIAKKFPRSKRPELQGNKVIRLDDLRKKVDAERDGAMFGAIDNMDVDEAVAILAELDKKVKAYKSHPLQGRFVFRQTPDTTFVELKGSPLLEVENRRLLRIDDSLIQITAEGDYLRLMINREPHFVDKNGEMTFPLHTKRMVAGRSRLKMDLGKQLGDMIRKGRESRGIPTHGMLGERVGLAPAAVQRIESGVARPSVKKLREIGEFLNWDDNRIKLALILRAEEQNQSARERAAARQLRRRPMFQVTGRYQLDPNMSQGENLLSLQVQMGLDRKGLASLIGMNLQHLYKIENNEFPLSGKIIKVLEQKARLSPAQVLMFSEKAEQIRTVIKSKEIPAAALKLGRMIREKRETPKISRNDFAAGLGIKYPTVSGIELGHKNPSKELLSQMMDQLEFSETERTEALQLRQEVADKALLSYGGINLDARLLDLQIKRDGKGIPLPLNQQPIENLKIEGFLPIIIDMQPINLPLLLGINNPKSGTDYSNEKEDKAKEHLSYQASPGQLSGRECA